jgi:hypothetical protein
MLDARWLVRLCHRGVSVDQKRSTWGSFEQPFMATSTLQLSMLRELGPENFLEFQRGQQDFMLAVMDRASVSFQESLDKGLDAFQKYLALQQSSVDVESRRVAVYERISEVALKDPKAFMASLIGELGLQAEPTEEEPGEEHIEVQEEVPES